MSADINGADAAIVNAIEKLAKEAESVDYGADGSMRLAAAVNQLAEARAWLTYRNQAHGGTSLPKDD